VLAAVPERTALVRDASGQWRSAGAGDVTLWVDGAQRDFDVLPVPGPPV
jgi:hypothetical protein